MSRALLGPLVETQTSLRDLAAMVPRRCPDGAPCAMECPASQPCPFRTGPDSPSAQAAKNVLDRLFPKRKKKTP